MDELFDVGESLQNKTPRKVFVPVQIELGKSFGGIRVENQR